MNVDHQTYSNHLNDHFVWQIYLDGRLSVCVRARMGGGGRSHKTIPCGSTRLAVPSGATEFETGSYFTEAPLHQLNVWQWTSHTINKDGTFSFFQHTDYFISYAMVISEKCAPNMTNAQPYPLASWLITRYKIQDTITCWNSRFPLQWISQQPMMIE